MLFLNVKSSEEFAQIIFMWAEQIRLRSMYSIVMYSITQGNVKENWHYNHIYEQNKSNQEKKTRNNNRNARIET